MKPARRIHIFGAGPPKSGTHSLDAIFGKNYRSSHEHRRARVLETIMAEVYGWINKDRAAELWKGQMDWANLEVNSSHHNVHFIDTIVKDYPEAKVVLTMRDVYSWVDSHINHDINRVAEMRLTALRDYRFGATRYTHHPEEQILKDHGVYTLRGYLAYWAWSYQKVIDTVPADRLMVVRLGDLKHKLPEIADFVGVDVSTLSTEKSHQFEGLGPNHLLRKLPHDYREYYIRHYAGSLMDDYFPDMKTIDDSRVE